MKVLALTTNTIQMACPRFRIYQYIPYLAHHGIDVEVLPFLDPTTEQILYNPGALFRKTMGIAGAAFRRLRALPASFKADLIYILREASLIGPPLLEWMLTRVGRRPMIFDLDDAVWEMYTSPTHGRLAMLLKMPGKTHTLFQLAQRVVAGNAYVADYARKFNTRVNIIPTVVDTEIFKPAEKEGQTGPVCVGWIGSHSTYQHLEPILPALQAAARQCSFRLLVVGADQPVVLPGVEVENRPWSLENEVKLFQQLDIGLYPLTEDPWSVGKSAFKAVQYGACGIPTVGSPVGAITSMVQPGENGFLASTQEQWIHRVVRLVQDHKLRQRVGAQARAIVEARYSVKTWASKMAELMRKSADKS